MKEDVVSDIFHNGLNDLLVLIDKAAEKAWNPQGTIIFRPIASKPVNNAANAKYYSIGADLGGSNNWYLRQISPQSSGHGNTSGQHTSAINFDLVNSNAPTWFAVATSGKSSSIIASEHELTTFKEIKYDYTGKDGNTKTYTFWAFKVESSYHDFIWWVETTDIPTYKYAKRYFVEDLGCDTKTSDIDFNDIVFDVVEYTNGEQECIVRALGGTIPVTITVCGKSWSKSDRYNVGDMINTGADRDYGKELASFPIKNWKPEDNSTISINVEDKNGFKFVTTFPKNGDIPLMVAFSIAKPWNEETLPVSNTWMSDRGVVE